MRYSVFALRATENAAVRRSWARDNGPKLEAYILGYLAGLAWLYGPNNKEDAITILRRNLPQMAPKLAAKSYAMLVNPRGLTPKAKLDMEGVLAFGQMRRELRKTRQKEYLLRLPRRAPSPQDPAWRSSS